MITQVIMRSGAKYVLSKDTIQRIGQLLSDPNEHVITVYEKDNLTLILNKSQIESVRLIEEDQNG